MSDHIDHDAGRDPRGWRPITPEQAAEVVGWQIVTLYRATGHSFEIHTDGSLRSVRDTREEP